MGDLVGHWGRVKLYGARVATDRARFADQSRAVRATESERVVRFNSIAQRTAFHSLVDRNLSFVPEGTVTPVAQRKVLFRTSAARKTPILPVFA